MLALVSKKKAEMKSAPGGPRVLDLASASTAYAALVDQLATIKAREGDAQREIDERHEKRRANPISDDELERKSRIAKLIGDKTLDADTADRVRLQELYREVRDLGDAAKIIEDRIRQERNRASAIVVDRVRDEYGRLVRAQCEKLVALLEAMTQYEALTGELESADVAWSSLRPMPMQWIGSPHDAQGSAAYYLREAAQHGFFEKNKIPARLQNAGVGPGAL